MYNLCFEVYKGLLLVRHFAPQIVMAVDYCGCQLDRRFGWTTPAHHKKEGATHHAGACTFSLQYDGRPSGRFGVWVGTWNIGSLSGKGGTVCEGLRKRMIDDDDGRGM